MGICRHLETGTKNQKFLENLMSAGIDLILAMSVLFSDTTLTMRKSRVHRCGVMHFWACGSLMSASGATPSASVFPLDLVLFHFI